MAEPLDTRLVSHHVGARGFVVAMDCPKCFEGDIVHVPARVWHQVVLPEGQAMTYMLINVMESW